MILKPRPFRKPRKGHWATKGLVGLWLFNEGSGGQVFDLSGNGNTGTILGTTSWVAGKYGSALSFPNSAGCEVQLGTSDVIDFTGSFTIVIGTYIATPNQDGIYGASDADAEGINIMMSGTGFDIWIFGLTDGYFSMANSAVVDNAWNEIALSYDGAAKKFYANGVLKISEADTGSITPVTGNYSIGECRGGFPYNSLVSHCYLYNRALSSSEVAQLYWNPFCMFEQDPIELWSAATLGGAPPAGAAGIMTPWGGYWGPTY